MARDTSGDFGSTLRGPPLEQLAMLPEAEVPTSNELTGSRPLYSRARMSTNGVEALKATVTVFVPAVAE
jgi:hypothetical protein